METRRLDDTTIFEPVNRELGDDGELVQEASEPDLLSSESRSATEKVSSDSSNVTESSPSNDIEHFIRATMPPGSVKDCVEKMTENQKYNLIKNHFSPEPDFIFTYQYEGGNYRSFQISWLQQYPWLVYSKSLDGAFCIARFIC